MEIAFWNLLSKKFKVKSRLVTNISLDVLLREKEENSKFVI